MTQAGCMPQMQRQTDSVVGADARRRAQGAGRRSGAGLSSAEVETRRAKYGQNKFAEAAKEPTLTRFLRQYSDPMQIVLLVAGGISLFLPGQFATGILLILLTVLNAFLGLNQEGKAEASVAALQKMMVVKAKVRAAARWPWSTWTSSSRATSSTSRRATSCRPTAASCAPRRSRSTSRR